MPNVKAPKQNQLHLLVPDDLRLRKGPLHIDLDYPRSFPVGFAVDYLDVDIG